METADPERRSRGPLLPNDDEHCIVEVEGVRCVVRNWPLSAWPYDRPDAPEAAPGLGTVVDCFEYYYNETVVGFECLIVLSSPMRGARYMIIAWPKTEEEPCGATQSYQDFHLAYNDFRDKKLSADARGYLVPDDPLVGTRPPRWQALLRRRQLGAHAPGGSGLMQVVTKIELNEYEISALHIATQYLAISMGANALSGEDAWFGSTEHDAPYGAAMAMAKSIASHVLGDKIGEAAVREALACGESILWVCNNRAAQIVPPPP
jgi:hypothetical protein